MYNRYTEITLINCKSKIMSVEMQLDDEIL